MLPAMIPVLVSVNFSLPSIPPAEHSWFLGGPGQLDRTEVELSESPAADREVGASEPCLSRTGHQLAGIYPRADNQHRVMLESVSGGD